MTDRLHLIFPCARPKNMVRLLPMYLEEMEPHPFELRIHILQQGPEPDPKGNYKVNEGIECCPGGWVMTLSDDTAQHPSLFRRLAEVAEQNPTACAIVFDQDRGPTWTGRILRCGLANMHPGCVCGSQIIWRRALLGNKWRFDFGKHQDRADGNMAHEIYAEHADKFVFVNETLCWFGSLEWGK